jgi:hypothetical protein
LDAVREEEEQSNIGLGHKWRVFVKMMQAICEHGSVPEQMRWEIIVLLPKEAVTIVEFDYWNRFGRSWRRLWWLD